MIYIIIAIYFLQTHTNNYVCMFVLPHTNNKTRRKHTKILTLVFFLGGGIMAEFVRCFDSSQIFHNALKAYF